MLRHIVGNCRPRTAEQVVGRAGMITISRLLRLQSTDRWPNGSFPSGTATAVAHAESVMQSSWSDGELGLAVANPIEPAKPTMERRGIAGAGLATGVRH